MEKTKNICFVILSLMILWLFSNNLHAEPMRVAENLRGETVLLPPSTPETEHLVLVSFFTITAEAEIIAAMAVYDDPRTRRSADYLELYNVPGDLLLASWIDKFGIRRTAMDRGLLQEDSSRLEGVLVLLLEGTPS